MKSISKKDFNNFTQIMWKRLKEGEKKYGNKFEITNIQKELEEEFVDIVNYSFMLYLRTKKLNSEQNGNAKFSKH